MVKNVFTDGPARNQRSQKGSEVRIESAQPALGEWKRYLSCHLKGRGMMGIHDNQS